MTEDNALVIRQTHTINSFKKQFFQKYGMDIEVSIKLPTYAMNGIELQDTDMAMVTHVLNQQIPFHIKNTYPHYTIFSKTRKRPIVELRHIFMKIAREKNFTLKHIASMCGVKDHSTVIYGANTANDLLLTDAHFLELYNTVTEQLQNLYTLENARTHQSTDQEQTDAQSTPVIPLYPGKSTPGHTDTIVNSGGTPGTERRLDNNRESVAAKGYSSTLGSRQTF